MILSNPFFQFFLVSFSAIVFHEFGHYAVAKHFQIFKRFYFEWGLAPTVDLWANKATARQLQLSFWAGIIFGLVPILLVDGLVRLVAVVFYVFCCASDVKSLITLDVLTRDFPPDVPLEEYLLFDLNLVVKRQ